MVIIISIIFEEESIIKVKFKPLKMTNSQLNAMRYDLSLLSLNVNEGVEKNKNIDYCGNQKTPNS
jgi:hypothetical protein